MQVTLGVAADELEIPGERNVTLLYAGAHQVCGDVTLPGMLGKLQRRAAVRDDKFGAAKGSASAGLQSIAQASGRHRPHEMVRAHADGDRIAGATRIARALVGAADEQ